MVNQDIIIDLIKDKIDNLDSFTAYDITLAAREHGLWVEHKEIRQIVHNAYNSDKDSNHYIFIDYECTEVNWGKGNVKVYHFEEFDPYDYANELAAKEKARIAYKTSQTTITPTTAKSTDLIKTVDNTQRLRFTKPLFDAVGIQAGNRVDVYLRDSEIIIISPHAMNGLNRDDDNDVFVNTYICDEYDNLRLSLKNLVRNPGSYKMYAENDRIYAVPVS